MLGDSGQGPISDGGGPGRLLAFAVAIALVLGGAWLYWKPALPALSGLAQPSAEQSGAPTAPAAIGQVPPQRRASYVIDSGQILSASAVTELNATLGELNVEAGPQVLVMTVPTLGDVPIDDYALRVANQWGIGDAERQDGVLVLVAPTEHRVRIEVGKGLHGVLTDELCAEIIRTDMLPLFRQGQLEAATLAGVSRLDAFLRQHPTIANGGR